MAKRFSSLHFWCNVLKLHVVARLSLRQIKQNASSEIEFEPPELPGLSQLPELLEPSEDIQSPKPPRRMTPRQRGYLYFFALGACAAAVVIAGVLSYFINGLPELKNLDGSLIISHEAILLDLHHRNEVLLAAGEQYVRPIAVAQQGAEHILLRVRLEETLLSLRRNHDGELVVVTRTYDDPRRDTDLPRTITQQQALNSLIEAGFFPHGTSWDAVLEARVPSRRLPDGTNDGGRILVLEKRTTVIDSSLGLPDLSYLHPDDLYELGIGITDYEFMGFLLIPAQEGFVYQPLHLYIDESEPDRAPSIAALSFEYYEWEIIQANVHRFDQPDNSIVMQPGALHPLSEWNGPTNAWFYDDDGWIYFGSPLPPGLMTPLLISGFGLAPGSQLPQGETRYRLAAFVQHTYMDHADIYERWNCQMPEGLGYNSISSQANALIMQMLEL